MKRIYRALLNLYPARFREEYAGPMERQFLDEYRDARGWPGRLWLWARALSDLAVSIPAQTGREMRQDLRYALRVYRQRFVLTTLAFMALSLAFGATTGIFSVLNAVLIRSLPFRDPGQLVQLWLYPTAVFEGRPAFQAWRGSSPYLADAAAYATHEMNLAAAGESSRIRVTETTAGFLQTLGTEPESGRAFSPEEDIPGRNGVAVIGHGLWWRLFGGDAGVLGSTIRLNGVPLTVIGVAPRGFDFPGNSAVWTPTIYEFGRLPKSGAIAVETIGRLRPDVTLAQATRMFEAEMERAGLGRGRPEIAGFISRPQLISLRGHLAGPVRPASLVLMAMAVFVLLIASAHVAHLLLSHTSQRRHELAIRAALGASRTRLVRQLVAEALLLTSAAAAAGLVVAHWAARLAASVQPPQLSARPYDVLDFRVIAFALGLSLLTAIVFGVLPASLIGRMQPSSDILGARRGVHGAGARRMRNLLPAMQAALTVVLLTGCFSLGRSFLRLLNTDLGYRTSSIVTLNVSLSGSRYGQDDREARYYAEAVARLRASPGVESAAAVSHLPLVSRMFTGGQFKLDDGRQLPVAVLVSATPGYFHTMGTPVVEGREFTAADTKSSEPVVVISDELARSAGAGRMTGRKIDLSWRGKPQWATIAGVVRAQRYSGPGSSGDHQIFRPVEQSPPGAASLVARVRGDAAQYLPACREIVQRIDRDIPVYDVRTLDQRLADVLARPRFYTAAIGFFAAFALLLALIGSYAVAAASAARRTHEIGVRLAVGASPRRIRAMLLRQSLLPAAAGLAAGLLASAGLSRFLQFLIAGAGQTGPAATATAALLLLLVTGLATWRATRRIVRMDAAAALRIE
jgi:putative ABC transport system permease protein